MSQIEKTQSTWSLIHRFAKHVGCDLGKVTARPGKSLDSHSMTDITSDKHSRRSFRSPGNGTRRASRSVPLRYYWIQISHKNAMPLTHRGFNDSDILRWRTQNYDSVADSLISTEKIYKFQDGRTTRAKTYQVRGISSSKDRWMNRSCNRALVNVPFTFAERPINGSNNKKDSINNYRLNAIRSLRTKSIDSIAFDIGSVCLAVHSPTSENL